MDRRSSCYLNSAYNRNVDDFDDYIDDESHLSFNGSNVGNRSYDSENETFVDAYFFDDHESCASEDDQLAAFDQQHIGNRSYSLQQLQRYHFDAYAAATSDKAYPDRVTSTPKKQMQRQQSLTPSGRKNPQRREAMMRRRSLSSLSYQKADPNCIETRYQRGAAAGAALRRSKSSLTLRPQHFVLDQTMARYSFQAARLNASRHGSERGSVTSTPTRASLIHNMSEPALRLPPSLSAAVSPFQIRQKALMQSPSHPPLPTDAPWSVTDNRNRSGDMFSVRNPFLRRPYDALNSSCSSSRPLVSRNTAIITPIYNKTTESAPSPFDVDHNSRMLSVSATEPSFSSTKTSSTWFQQLRKPRLPLCTLRTSAITLLISGTLTCLLCIHIISQRGKSYELTFSLISGFVILCLGFPCLRFQEWQWLPNRNYVSGYIILSLFSVLQSTALWVLDKYPDLQPEFVDLTRGALYGLSSLSMSVALLGVCASCCCKYPPPDNRVNHGVQGFTV